MKELITTKKVTLFIFSYDYADFLDSCLETCKRELDEKISWVVVETGKTENTQKIVSHFALKNSMPIDYLRLPPDTSTLRALQILANKFHKEFAILISADDALGIGYGAALRSELLSLDQIPVVVNFSHMICNESLNPIENRHSRWSNKVEMNKFLLSKGNPGNTAGVLLPWKHVQKIFQVSDVPDILIEDYWLWWKLVETTEFKNNLEGRVLYRRHDRSISKAKRNPKYAFSLGYISALPIPMNNSIINKVVGTTLIPRWIIHLHFSVWKHYLSGYIESLRAK